MAMSWLEAQRFRTYPWEVFFGVISRLGETLLYIIFWVLVSRYALSGDIDTRQIVSFYLIASGITPFFYLGYGIGSMTIRLIKSGELNQVLIKPINPILYPWAIRTGRNAVNLSIGALQVLVGVAIAGGIAGHSLPYLVPILFNTLLINASFNIMIGTVGFYTVEAMGIKNSFELTAGLLRGSLIPLFLMPASVAAGLQLSPFPASQYHLARLLQGYPPEWKYVVIGSVWAVGLVVLAVKFWHRGLEKYEATGI